MAKRQRSSLDWSRPLPRPLVIPDVMTLRTLADVRELIEKYLPDETRSKSTWQYVVQKLDAAARGGDIIEAVASARVVFMLENVPCAEETAE
jgi:hypothetical protein